MAGTVIGGKRAARTNKKLYGKNFYKKLGAKGGKLGSTGGFGSDKIGPDGLTGKERARIAGQRGGTTSRRTWSEKQRNETSKRNRQQKEQAKAHHSFIDRILGRKHDTNTNNGR